MRVGIVGLGHIGGSLARELTDFDTVTQVFGVDANPTHASQALEMRLVDEVLRLDEMYHQVSVIQARN